MVYNDILMETIRISVIVSIGLLFFLAACAWLVDYIIRLC